VIVPGVGPQSSAPTFAQGKVLFGTDKGRFIVVDVATQTLCQAQVSNPPVIFSTPAVDGNNVYIGAGNVPTMGAGVGPNKVDLGIWTADLSAPNPCSTFTQLINTQADVYSSPAVSAGDGIFFSQDRSKAGPAEFIGVNQAGAIQFNFVVP